MKSHEGKHSGDGMEEHRRMMREHQGKMLWSYWTVIMFGTWLLASPATFHYGSPALAWSDALSGAASLILGLLALKPKWYNLRWGTCLVGIWLLFAPLVFWAPTPFEYAQDTLLGALLIAFSVLVPGMPGMGMMMTMMAPGPDVPRGWTYNPSSWVQRGPMIAIAFLGFLVSRSLAAFELGHTDAVWEPFFGDGTRRVLTSSVSRMWPVPDAGLGAAAYMLEMLSGYMGDQRRWRTMPWMVLMFGVLVIPLGITHIVLVILQPVVVGAWCTLCLVAATLMLLMIPLAVDEVVAMGQFLARSRREGKPFWRTFWMGGTTSEGEKDTRTPHFGAKPLPSASAMLWGVSVTPALLLSLGIGLWLMFAPGILGRNGTAADSDHVAGALVVTISTISTAEVLRAGRLLNILAGLWIAASPFIFQLQAAKWCELLAGLLLVALGLPRGKVKEHYGSWNRFIFIRRTPEGR